MTGLARWDTTGNSTTLYLEGTIEGYGQERGVIRQIIEGAGNFDSYEHLGDIAQDKEQFIIDQSTD